VVPSTLNRVPLAGTTVPTEAGQEEQAGSREACRGGRAFEQEVVYPTSDRFTGP
jgi:hypothetical protein